MIRKHTAIFLAFAFCASLTLRLTPAFADTLNCTNTISSLPATLSTSGTYCLTSDLQINISSGFAISILANDVTLDFNGYTISNTNINISSNTSYGVIAQGTVNSVIKNGKLDSFRYGIAIYSGATPAYVPVVDSMQINRSVQVGIGIDASGAIVKNCIVTNTGLNLFDNSYGIVIFSLSQSSSNLIQNNIILKTSVYSNKGTGIAIFNSNSAVVEQNRIIGATKSAVSYDIYSTGGVMRDNLQHLNGSFPYTPYTGAISFGNY